MCAFFLNVCPFPYYGLSNQLYSILGTCSYCVSNNIKIIFLNKFLKQIHTDDYCNISEILDIPKTNEYLQNYNLQLVDVNNYTFEIASIKYGNKHFNIELIKYFKSDVKKISKNIDFNKFEANPKDIFYNKVGIELENELLITYKIDGKAYNSIYDLTNDIDFDFKNYQFSNSLRYNDGSEIFINGLRNLKFNEKYVSLADNYIKDKLSMSEINCIHLRLENDAIESWSKQNNMTFEEYKILIENKYINTIKKYIKKDQLTILLAHDYNNNVVKYLDENEYNYIKPPKMDTSREILAIIDMHIGQYCNKTYIFVFESSFSFALLCRIYNKKNVKSVMLEFNDIENIEEKCCY